MNRLVTHIEYLVRHHDCVVLPGVGALIKRSKSAVYDDVTDVIFPPCDEFAFNSAIIYDDGLIASSIARRESIPYSEAANILAGEIEAMHTQLLLDGTYPLGRLGSLKSNIGGGISFEPCTTQDELKPVTLSKILESDTPEETPISVTPFSVASKFTDVASRIVAVVALALILGFAVYNPARIGEDVMKASFLPELRIGFERVATAEVEETSLPDEENIVIVDESDAEEMESRDIYEVQVELPSPRYYLIVASLPTAELAHQFIADENGSGFSILQADGRFRVCAAAGSTIPEVRIPEILARYPDAWVYTNK